MLGSLRDNDHITSLDLLLFTSNNSFADSTGEDQVLIDTMYLFSNISTNRNSHDDQLTALACPEDISEFGVLGWDSVDSLKMVHFLGWGWHLGSSGWVE